MKTSKQKIISYVIIVGVILAVAGLGSLFVNLGMDWFNTLDRPSDFVSNVFIPIMWTIIYGVYMVVLCIWTSKTTIPKNVKIWLIINAILNVLWCLVFFTLNQLLLGLIAIVLLLISAWVLVVFVYAENKTYSYFLAIYPVWASIATTLNLALWILN